MPAVYSSIVAASFSDHLLGHGGAEFADGRASVKNEDCLACSQMFHSNVSATKMNHFLAEGVFIATLSIQIRYRSSTKFSLKLSFSPTGGTLMIVPRQLLQRPKHRQMMLVSRQQQR
jgi:hypothetical protein